MIDSGSVIVADYTIRPDQFCNTPTNHKIDHTHFNIAMNAIVKSSLIASVILCVGTAMAQMPNSGQRFGATQLSAEDMAKMQTEQVAQTLKLSDAQIQAIYQLNLANATEQLALMEQMRKLQQAREAATDEAMKKILDESQYKKWSKQQKQQQSRMRRPMGQRVGSAGGFGGPGGMGGGGFGTDPGGFGGSFDNGMGF